ncbi:MAG: transposase [Verrucomicrobiales bacterium]
MARALRIDFPGAWHHVTSRGNERREVFHTEGDRRRWLELLAQLPERFGAAIHAYVLMPNHYHVIIEGGAVPLSWVMQWLNVSYTVWFNRRHHRVGHLFQGRYSRAERDSLPERQPEGRARGRTATRYWSNQRSGVSRSAATSTSIRCASPASAWERGNRRRDALASPPRRVRSRWRNACGPCGSFAGVPIAPTAATRAARPGCV